MAIDQHPIVVGFLRRATTWFLPATLRDEWPVDVYRRRADGSGNIQQGMTIWSDSAIERITVGRAS